MMLDGDESSVKRKEDGQHGCSGQACQAGPVVRWPWSRDVTEAGEGGQQMLGEGRAL